MREQDLGLFVEREGVLVRGKGVLHREDEFDQCCYDLLVKMQREHFWYLGRCRFLLGALKEQLSRLGRSAETLTAIDLGAGCGGWVDYLTKRSSLRFKEVALGDSSLRALNIAATIVKAHTERFQVDLLDLGWVNRWDIVFLLDVLEHIPEDLAVLQQIQESLTPDGLLFVTAPAMKAFWSYNDELASHQRRYSRRDLQRLANESGLKLVKTRYFMFFLSPLLYLSRLRSPNTHAMSREQIKQLLEQTHRVPIKPLNLLLHAVFSLETPLGLRLPFPWGTCVLGVFQK